MGVRAQLADRVKKVLDRRYVGRDEIARVIEAVELLDQSVRALQERVQSLSVSGGPGDQFVGEDDPAALRKAFKESARLADECSRAIELLLQADILLRRDLDAVS